MAPAATQMPYLGDVRGFYTDWTPLKGRPVNLVPGMKGVAGERPACPQARSRLSGAAQG